ncbi:MAG: hypothetical protein R3261_05545, partial [Alphaproteobacteria bacterium]|nr:hypothetical protein [Alphaproteobacteria bacterium]
LGYLVIWGLSEMANNLGGDKALSVVPEFSLAQYILLAMIAPLASLIAMYAARHTVLKSLRQIL